MAHAELAGGVMLKTPLRDVQRGGEWLWAFFKGVTALARTGPLLFLSACGSGQLLRLWFQHYARAGTLSLWEGILPGCPGALLKPRLWLMWELRLCCLCRLLCGHCLGVAWNSRRTGAFGQKFTQHLQLCRRVSEEMVLLLKENILIKWRSRPTYIIKSSRALLPFRYMCDIQNEMSCLTGPWYYINKHKYKHTTLDVL